MKKYFLAILFATCFILPISSNENIDASENYIDDETELNAFGFPDK